MSGPLPRMGWALLLALSSLIAGGMRSCVSTARADPLPLVRGVGCIGLTVSDGNQRVLLHRARSRIRAILEPHLRRTA